MMRVDMQIAVRLNIHVYQTVPSDLIEHVIEKGYTGYKRGFARSIQVNTDFNLGFERVTFDLGCAWSHCSFKIKNRIFNGLKNWLSIPRLTMAWRHSYIFSAFH